MSSLQTQFRNDTMSGIFSLTGKVWVPVTIAYAVTSILTLLIIAPVLMNIFGFDLTMLQDMVSGGDPQEQMDRMEALMESAAERILQPANLALILVVGLVSAIISMYVLNVAFVANEASIREEPISLGGLLSRAFNADVFRLFIAYLLISILSGIVYILIVAVVGLVASALDLVFLSVILGLAGLVGLMMFAMKFILTLPAIVHGDLGVGEAVSYSFRTITWRKSMKYFLISIVIGIILMVAMVIMMMVQALFGFIPVIGPILGQLVGMAIYGVLAAFSYAALSALYFKRTSDIDSPNELDEHLILDS